MSTLPLEARIRWNRLQVIGALVHVERDLVAVESRWRTANVAWRWGRPALAAAGLAWSLRARSGPRRGGRLVGILLGARAFVALSRALRAMFFLPSR